MTKIITNNRFRDLLNSFDLTKKEFKEFDYMSEDELLEASFFRYRGTVYNLADFVVIIRRGNATFSPFAHFDNDDTFKAWDGIHTDSFFSAIVVKYNRDCDAVKVGLALS